MGNKPSILHRSNSRFQDDRGRHKPKTSKPSYSYSPRDKQSRPTKYGQRWQSKDTHRSWQRSSAAAPYREGDQRCVFESETLSPGGNFCCNGGYQPWQQNNFAQYSRYAPPLEEHVDDGGRPSFPVVTIGGEGRGQGVSIQLPMAAGTSTSCEPRSRLPPPRFRSLDGKTGRMNRNASCHPHYCQSCEFCGGSDSSIQLQYKDEDGDNVKVKISDLDKPGVNIKHVDRRRKSTRNASVVGVNDGVGWGTAKSSSRRRDPVYELP